MLHLDWLGVVGLTVVTIISLCSYIANEKKLEKDFFDRHPMTNEEKAKIEKEESNERAILAVRLIVWLGCAISALYGEILGVVLSMIFTIEALIRIYRNALETADKSLMTSLTYMIIPPAMFIAIVGMRCTGNIWGILPGLLVVFLVKGIAYIGNLLKRGER